MINLVPIEEHNRWDGIVRNFPNHDVYYLSGYVEAFRRHGDGEPYLLYYSSQNLRAIYVFMKRETAIQGAFDSITPYGYGGVLFDGTLTGETLREFHDEYVKTMIGENIVCNFVRYHPVLRNAQSMKAIANVLDLGKTIMLDLSSPEIIWQNITSKNRNMIRKAEKNGVEIQHGRGAVLLNEFKKVYNVTMDKDHAESYYYFGDEFYKSIEVDLANNHEIFYASLDGKIIAMSIIIFANGNMHYHLSGSLSEFRNLAPSNLLLYRAALWGHEQGFRTFHLGGGVGAGEDSLYKFKAAFNRNSDITFSIGKEIFDSDLYRQLVDLRCQSDHEFNSESTFFPLYRS